MRLPVRRPMTATQRNQRDDARLRRLMRRTLRRDSNCLDVGAHSGTFLAEFQRLAPRGNHIAYEPMPALASALSERFPDVDVREVALSDEDGESTFVHVVDLPEYSGLRERSYPRDVATETITVRTERLDDHLPDGWLPAFVKIDVEGGELGVLKGAVETLNRAGPVVAFEHGPGAADRYGTTPADIHALLTEVGLRIFDMDGHGPLSLAEFEDNGGRFNWIARH
ncbi:MAG: FkbM family methyltransferase [Acidimicrobiales bacterium]